MKLFMYLFIGVTMSFAGEIEEQFLKINALEDREARIEMKLDLVLKQYIKEERKSDERSAMIGSAVESTKETLNKSADWISKKLTEE